MSLVSGIHKHPNISGFNVLFIFSSCKAKKPDTFRFGLRLKLTTCTKQFVIRCRLISTTEARLILFFIHLVFNKKDTFFSSRN